MLTNLRLVDQTRCRLEDSVEVPHVDAIHPSKDSVTMVNAIDEPSVLLTRALSVSVVSILLSERSCVRHAVETGSVIRLT